MAFQVSGRDIDLFQVVRFRGTTALCQLYKFDIELATEESGITLESIVGKPAALSINTDTGERWFHGIIAQFEMTGETYGLTYYRAELVPLVWLLTQRYASRIFQNKNTKEIITDILTRAGIPSDRFDLGKLKHKYEPREYCVQYRETDYNFITRLMEEEGIWWYFEQKQDGHVLTLADDPGAYAPIEGEAALPYRPPSGMPVETEHVFRFGITHSVRPGTVSFNEWDFENPGKPMDSYHSVVEPDEALAYEDYPGKYKQEERGRDLAYRRLQEFQIGRVIGLGRSNSKRLAPAKIFELIEHPSESMNAKYVVTSVSFQGKQAVPRTSTADATRTGVLEPRLFESILQARQNDNPVIRELAEGLLQIASRFRAGDGTIKRALNQWVYHAGQVSRDLSTAGVAGGENALDWLMVSNLIQDVAQSSVLDFDAPIYECRFECIPAGAYYCPPRVTPWPVLRGPQTAVVVGPENEEIHTDKYGRVKVQFHWDREGNEGGKAKLYGSDSSCWIRVSHGWAGGNYGVFFLPRVGQEVIVDFLEGDPDRPIIVGSVCNAHQMPPYPLPGNKTRSIIKTRSSKGGGGTNEIRFEDLKGKEQLFIQAQRQMDLRVKASHFHTVGGAYHIRVGDEMRELVYKTKHVHIKEHLRTYVEGEEHRAVGGLQAVEIGGTRSHLIRADAIDVFEANHQHEVTSTYYLKAGDVKIEASGSIELVAGGSSIVLSSGGIWITGPMVYINSGSGPPVPPTAVAGMCPAAAEDACAADKSEPGKDFRYSGEGFVPPPIPPLPEVPGHDFPEEEVPETATSWIEIELVDEAEQPVAGEAYEVTTPDGKIKRGTTDSRGRAKISGIQPGECKIVFPRLDADAWRRGA
jgi:type VI secretion system secreted protein VgrG